MKPIYLKYLHAQGLSVVDYKLNGYLVSETPVYMVAGQNGGIIKFSVDIKTGEIIFKEKEFGEYIICHSAKFVDKKWSRTTKKYVVIPPVTKNIAFDPYFKSSAKIDFHKLDIIPHDKWCVRLKSSTGKQVSKEDPLTIAATESLKMKCYMEHQDNKGTFIRCLLKYTPTSGMLVCVVQNYKDLIDGETPLCFHVYKRRPRRRFIKSDTCGFISFQSKK